MGYMRGRRFEVLTREYSGLMLDDREWDFVGVSGSRMRVPSVFSFARF
jgi:hypothetical protein